MSETIVRTPLQAFYSQCGAELAPFMGCLMPVHFGDAEGEHMAVRTDAGLFDANHRCEVVLSGADVVANLQNLLCTDVRTLEEGFMCRSLMLNMQGGVMDDVQLYRMGETHYRLAMHTVNREKDLRHIQRQKTGEMFVAEAEGECRLSLDGPGAEKILTTLAQALPGRKGQFVHTTAAGIPCRISRIGFADEDGFSLCCSAQDGLALHETLRQHARLCGTASFHSLRLEAAHSLYGLEMDDAVSPMDTGFKHLVRMDKRAFVGKDALVAAGEPRYARIGLVLENGVASAGMPVMHRDKQVGHVTSGAYCPGLRLSAALALVEKPYSEVGRKLRVEDGDTLLEAQVAQLPFYSRVKD